jgi:hypothetical protein
MRAMSFFGAEAHELSVTTSRTSSRSVAASSTTPRGVTTPPEDEERMAGVSAHLQLLPRRAERQHDQRTDAGVLDVIIVPFTDEDAEIMVQAMALRAGTRRSQKVPA